MAMLSAKEQIMHDEILLVLVGTIIHERAALKLGVSTRTIRRKIGAYFNEGIERFAHKSRRSTPHNASSIKD